MEIVIESLPGTSEIALSTQGELADLITACKLSSEDMATYEGWFTARELGASALVGCVGYETRAENIYMQSLSVRQENRRQGIGEQLSSHLFDSLESGQNLVALTLFWNNQFYRSIGFNRVNAKILKARDDIAGREKHRFCTAWIKEAQ